MPRKRRSPEQAKSEILEAARLLLLEEGPDALKLARIAKKAQRSHPLVLHHFGSIDQLIQSLQDRIARDIRNQLLESLQKASVEEGIAQVLHSLSSPEHARLMAWLIARGYSPFPPAEEKGLQQIQQELHRRTGRNSTELGNNILLVLFAMYGEGLFGNDLRERLGMENSEQSKKEFRVWLLSLLG